MTRIVAALLVIVVSVTTLFVAYPPKKAEAAFNIAACATTPAQRAAQAALAQSTAAGFAAAAVMVTDIPGAAFQGSIDAAVSQNNFKESCFDAIFYFVAELLITHMTQSIVQWINTGFEGSPSFITNPGQFFADIANEEFLSFVETVFPNTAGIIDFFCSPNLAFDLKIRFYLRYSHESTERKVQCTVTDVIDNTTGLVKDFESFVGGEFAQGGGWNRWFQVTQNPNNNKFGLDYTIESEFLKQLARTVGEEETVANWGRGFRSKVENLEEGINSVITLPGATIEDSLNRALGAPAGRLQVADEFNEIVSALLGQLVNQVLQRGLSGVSRSGSGSGSGSYLDDLRNQSEDCTPSNQEGCEEAVYPNTPTSTPPFTPTTTVPVVDNSNEGNVALNKSATMSSYEDDLTSPGAAVDGRVGRAANFDNATTQWQRQPWWQVDLQGLYTLSEIEIWPRPNAGDATGNFFIMTSPNPMSRQESLEALLDRPDVRSLYVSGGIPNPPYVGAMGSTTARYVRIQRAEEGNKKLRLAEVKVYGIQN